MTAFLGEIGQKLADRWAALLVLPGLLYLTAVTVGVVLGQRRALDYEVASRHAVSLAASPELKSTGGTALIVIALLIGSLAAGLAAAAGGKLVERLWTVQGTHRPARWLANWRHSRWLSAATSAARATTRGQWLAAQARADRICLVEASRPTWIGDRLRACHVRIQASYGLDLAAAWPRMWLIVPDAVRSELGSAQDAFGSAARLAAWAVLYLLLGIWWWPAALIGLGTALAAAVKGRTATGALADLIESAADLYCRDLASQLGEPSVGRLTPDSFRQINTLMRKSIWDPGSPLNKGLKQLAQ
jgi:hypothetical protein